MTTNIYSFLETSGGKSSNLYSNVVHFFNTSVNYASVAAEDSCFPALVSNMHCSIRFLWTKPWPEFFIRQKMKIAFFHHSLDRSNGSWPKCESMAKEAFSKGKAQYSWPPCINYFGSAHFYIKMSFTFFTKQAKLIRRSTVQSLPL